MTEVARNMVDCDNQTLANHPSAMTVRRYNTAAVKLTRNAGTGNLETTSGQAAGIFVKGVGQDGANQGFPAGYVLGLNETDSFPDGAPVDEGQGFATYGMGVVIGEPFIYDSQNKCRQWASWLEEYRDAILRAVARGVVLRFKLGNNACFFDMGPLDFYPSPGGLQTNGAARIGDTLAGLYTPSARVLGISARDTSNKFNGKLVVGGNNSDGDQGTPFCIVQNAAEPTQADVYVPITVELYGETFCENCSPACAPGSVDNEAIAQRVAAILKGG
jgi:hypothetical protein